nr:MAG TPA: hypothetical protein [Caudoviricetes sp.]DAO63337.1 MAG TPA: hypothetical protein [Caudoviricetes sp.]
MYRKVVPPNGSSSFITPVETFTSPELISLVRD